ncbi:MAG: hypothetical protein JWN30_2689 [Bacilli bacterium]|nr:hypothetical protein [Bacilli bacterium]
MPKKVNPTVSFSLRPYTFADNPFLVKLVQEQMQPILENATGAPYNPEQFLYHVQTSHARILESDNRPIGFFTYLPLYEEGRLLFSSMILEQEFQGRGIGKKVFEFIEQEALRLNCPEVEVEVQRGNDGALRLYRELGYQEVAVPWEHTIRLRKYITQENITRVLEPEPEPVPAAGTARKPAAAVGAAKKAAKSSPRTSVKPSRTTRTRSAGSNGLKSFR